MSAQIQQKYEYSNIKSFSNQGDYNFFGIIYDATFPIPEDACTYTCSLKIVDPEVNLLANSATTNRSTVKESAMSFIQNLFTSKIRSRYRI